MRLCAGVVRVVKIRIALGILWAPRVHVPSAVLLRLPALVLSQGLGPAGLGPAGDRQAVAARQGLVLGLEGRRLRLVLLQPLQPL